MKTLDDKIEIQINLLEEAGEICRILPGSIETYTKSVSFIPQVMVKLRLDAVQGLIKAYENALRVQHGDKGNVFAQVGHGALRIFWSELDFSKGEEKSPSSGESLFMKVEVVLKKIEELISQVDSGDLLPAIGWLNRYEDVSIHKV
jgi:hypothetical protein